MGFTLPKLSCPKVLLCLRITVCEMSIADGQPSLISETNHSLEMPVSLSIQGTAQQASGDHPCAFQVAQMKRDVSQPPSMDMKTVWASDRGQGAQHCQDEVLPAPIAAGGGHDLL